MIGAFPLFTLLLLIAWIIIFALHKELRREMIILSLCAFFLAPIIVTVKGGDTSLVAERFSGLHFFDLLFSFTVAGLAGSIYHAIFGKHYHRLPKIKSKKATDGTLVQIWLIRLFIGTLIFLWGIVFCTFAFDLSPAPAALVTGIVMGVYIVIHRHDLLADTLLSGLLTGLVAFIAGSIALFGTSIDFQSALIAEHGYIGNIPIDLVTWSVAFGFGLGPLYEYIRRIAVA